MKKMLIAIIVLLLIVIFLLLYCNCRKKCIQCGDDKKLVDSCKVFCSDFSNEDLRGIIDFNQLVQMSNAYASDPGKNTITDTRQPDALSMVFDLKKIKTLIWQMEHYICTNNCDDRKVGIRYYYIKYPSTVGTAAAPECLRGIAASEKNKHALVMVPAYFDKPNQVWRDFDIWNNPKKCFSPFLLLGNSHQDSLIRVGFAPTDGDGGDNHGGIGPPPVPGSFPSNGE